MPFTTSLNLELVARGAEVGTWDTPENSNWDLVDVSIGGAASIALTNSPVTLSQSQYKNQFITLTGAISANIALTFPNKGRTYTLLNMTSNTSAFYVTAATTVAGGQAIGLPPGEAVDVMCDATNMKFRNMGRVGSYWDYAGSSNPAWNTACTVPPYLDCSAGSFSSATYPILATILGGTTLPDSRGRTRFALNAGTGRLTTTGGIDGNTKLAGGGDGDGIALATTNLPPYTPSGSNAASNITATVTGQGGGVFVFAGGGSNLTGGGAVAYVITGLGVSGTADAQTWTGVAQGGNSTPLATVSPGYVGGVTLIRAA